MALEFVDGGDVQIEHLIVTIYGRPGVGKTSLALTAPSPLILDYDGGIARASNRAGKSVVRVRKWNDIARLEVKDLKDYKTIVVDTVGTALSILAEDIVRKDRSMSRGSEGSLTLQGYGALKSRFARWLGNIRRSNRDVVLVAHLSEEKRGDRHVDRIIAEGSSKMEIYSVSDLMGKLDFDSSEKKDDESAPRVIDFNPSRVGYGKNCGLPVLEIPHPSKRPDMLARILFSAKKRMNEAMSATPSHDGLTDDHPNKPEEEEGK